MKAIINTNIILPEGIIYDGVLLFDNSGIIDFGDARAITVPAETEVTDARGHYTAPGFIDIHCHGGGGYWFHENPQEAARYFLAHGVTTILPTLYINLTLEEYQDAFSRISAAMQQSPGRIIHGIYMEGPYLNPKYGCDPRNNKWTGSISKAQYDKLLQSAGSLVKVWCIAPERDGVAHFVRDAKKEGVVFSVAHSEATPEQVYRFLRDGLKLQTHHTNATGCRSVIQGVREPGVDEAVLLCDDIYAELICDSLALHVRPHMIKLALKTKGKDKIILISDSTEFGFPPPDGSGSAPDIRYDQDGNIAGSALTLDAACRNMMRHTGAGLCDVFRFSSLNPAKLLGLDDSVGMIAKNHRANLVVIDHAVNIKHVFLDGDAVPV